MSHIEEFARQLAADVYLLNFPDEEILTRFRFPDTEKPDEEHDRWLREQIQAVKSDPKTYQGFLT